MYRSVRSTAAFGAHLVTTILPTCRMPAAARPVLAVSPPQRRSSRRTDLSPRQPRRQPSLPAETYPLRMLLKSLLRARVSERSNESSTGGTDDSNRQVDALPKIHSPCAAFTSSSAFLSLSIGSGCGGKAHARPPALSQRTPHCSSPPAPPIAPGDAAVGRKQSTEFSRFRCCSSGAARACSAERSGSSPASAFSPRSPRNDSATPSPRPCRS